MIELSPTGAFGVLRLPLEQGETRLSAIAPPRITAIAPYPGQMNALSRRLGAFPAPGEVHDGQLRLVWSGREMAFAFGEGLPEGLEDFAALCDQSDAWAGLALVGQDAQAVLARLVALDLRALAAPSSARALMGHLPLLLIKESDTRFDLWTFRSMADSLVHEMEAAMRGVAARRAIS